ncbi:MAG: SGNH/GDSL hydrolase family protein [Nocardiopsaceae bacterium]|nr:SGNH/GDSL hydrolase family protein [Nocardiopsaceae bacterium]
MRSIRTFTISTLGLSSAAVLALSAFGGPAKAASSVNYVALGDSYSSGVGAGTTTGSCAQSNSAYGPLWAKANSPASFTFAACSGATTTDVINSQLSSLSSSTTLVSLTIGGNDAGFSSVMETCVLESTSSCQAAVAKAEQYAQTTLPGKLDTMLSDIKAKAPNAKIVMLGYPEFYDLSASVCVGLSSADHKALDQAADVLDGVIQTAASGNGAYFADVRGQFSGHELCDNAGWLNSVDITNIDASYHPTATGQQDGYLPVFSAAAKAVGQ